MNTLNTAVNCLLAENDNFHFVAVNFQGSSKQYHYKTTLLNLAVGDQVVVATGANDKLQVVNVVGIVEFDEIEDDSIEYKWVVSKVDTTEYEKCLEAEAKVMKALRTKKRAHTRKQAMLALFNDVSEDDAEAVKKLARL